MNKIILFLIGSLLSLAQCKQAPKVYNTSEPTPIGIQMTENTVKHPTSNVMAIYQDSKGVYWFGSHQTGLYQYDGKTIVHHNTENGLPSNRVEAIKEDKQGNILVNTSVGLYKYDGRQFLKIPEASTLATVWQLEPNDLWFKSPTNGHVYRYDGRYVFNLELPKTPIGEAYIAKYHYPTNPYDVYCTYKDSKGHIWFGTAMLGALRYNGLDFDWILEPDVTELHDGPSNGVRSIIEDKEGYFWFNTDYKYSISDTKATDNSVPKPAFYNRIKSIGSVDGNKYGDLNEYLSIIKDKHGQLWTAFYIHGVWMHDGQKTKHFPVQVNGQNIPIYCLYEDNKGNIWLGTHEHGAFKFNGQAFEPFIP